MTHYQVCIALAGLVPRRAFFFDGRQEDRFANAHFKIRFFAAAGALPALLEASPEEINADRGRDLPR